MSATVDYVKVVDRLTDAIKELNQPCEVAVPISEEERRADLRSETAGLLRLLLSALEQPAGAGALAPAAAAEHSASADTNKNFKWFEQI
jgi:hypothetical protein